LDVATPVTDVAALAAIDAANTLDELVNVWKSLTKEEQKMPTVTAAKDAKKEELTPKTETE
jgi:cell division protein ZapA (FtsZ GTPase activity inhibitor)